MGGVADQAVQVLGVLRPCHDATYVAFGDSIGTRVVWFPAPVTDQQPAPNTFEAPLAAGCFKLLAEHGRVRW